MPAIAQQNEAAPAAAAAQAEPGTAVYSLADLIQSAIRTNPQITAAAQQLAQVQAKVGQAQAQKRFQLTFNSTVSGSDASVIQPPPSHETFGTLQNTISTPLPLGRKAGLAVTQAQRQLTAAQAQYTSARLALAGQVTMAYFDLLRKQAARDIAQDVLTQAERDLSTAQKRNRAGDVPELDVLQAQTPVSSATAGLAKAEIDVVIARQTLNDLAGRPLDAPLAVASATGLAPPPPYTLARAQALALQRSADVQVADANVRAGEAAVQSARLYREPQYSLQVSDQRSTDQTSFSRLDTVQAAVTLPLSDGGLGAAQVREAQAALAQSRAQAQSARKTALTAVTTAYLTSQSARAQVAAAKEAQDVAQVTYDKTVRGYQNGLFPLINVLNAQTALAQTRKNYIQTLYDALSSDAALAAAIAGGTALSSAPSGAAPGALAPNTPGSAAPGAPGGAAPPASATPAGTPPANAPAAGGAPANAPAAGGAPANAPAAGATPGNGGAR